MSGLQLDHIDTRKENNSWCNLAWVTSQKNQEMVGPEWPIERKRAWNDSRVFVDTPPEIRRTKFLS